MKYGPLLKSVIGDGEIKCLHVGLDDPSVLASMKSVMKKTEFFVTDTDDDSILPWVNLVGPISGDIGVDYDLFIVPATASSFSTSIYIAIEGALKNGGILAIYGEIGCMRSRSSLFVEMIKEGTIAPFSHAMFNDKEMLIFVLEDGVLVRGM